MKGFESLLTVSEIVFLLGTHPREGPVTKLGLGVLIRGRSSLM